MEYRLLLVDGSGVAVSQTLRLRTLREFPGSSSLSIHFRPIRSDGLFESAKSGGQLAYRILCAEGVTRSQLWVEFECDGSAINVTGRSADLLFALALTMAVWKPSSSTFHIIAATGELDAQGVVRGVQHVAAKLAAAVEGVPKNVEAVVFYPADDATEVERWRNTVAIPSSIRLVAVGSIENALSVLGHSLEKLYLGNPFRGLAPFDYEHRAVFFGREREVQEILGILCRRERAGVPGVLVEGASGSGKSSFLRAGVLPALVHARAHDELVRQILQLRPVSAEMCLAIWRPGELAENSSESDLVASIQVAWARLPAFAAATVRPSPDTLEALAEWRVDQWPAEYRFVWVIDQFEELLKLNREPAIFEEFGKFLLRLQAQGVWILVSARADAMPELKQIESLRHLFGSNDGQYYLPTLQGVALDDVITRPAAAAQLAFGIRSDGKCLDQQLREDAYREGHSLPLLQFTLNELYLHRAGNELSWSTYKQLGGLAGCISAAAAAALGKAGEASRKTLTVLLRTLVNVDAQGRPSRRFAALSESADDPEQRKLLQRLIDSRLCVTDQRDGVAVVAFAHDTLLQSLPAVSEWLRQETGLLQTRDLAEQDARLWQEHGQSVAWLASADKLAAFRALHSAEVNVSGQVRTFIDRSIQRDRRLIRLKSLAVGAIAALAIVASITGWVATRKQHEAEQQTAQTRRMQQKLAIQVAADRLQQGALSTARAIILSVLDKRDPRKVVDPIAGNVFQEIRSQDSLLAVLPVHEREARHIRYSPDGKRLAVVPLIGPIQVWDAELGIKLMTLGDNTNNIGPAEFSPDGSKILSGGSEVYLWDAQTGKVIQHQKISGVERAHAHFSAEW